MSDTGTNGIGKGTGNRAGRNGSGNGTGGSGTDRRDFLKLLGLGGAGAAASACGPPDTGDRLIPYLVQPEEVVPGTNTYYATVLTDAGPEPLPVHATVRDGRLINLEVNPRVRDRVAGLTPLALSSLQDLYDPDRIPAPRRGGADGEEIAWEAALQDLGDALSGGGMVLLSDAAPGSSLRFLREFASAVDAEHVRYEALGLESLRAAHRIAFGRAEIPSYRLDRADHVVSFGADFLDSWLAPAELSRRFSRARAVDDGRYAPLVFVGPRLSLTGTNADRWLPARSGSEALVALSLAHVAADRMAGGRGLEVSGLVAEYDPESVAETAGVDAADIVRLGEELAEADAPVVLPPGVAGQTAAGTDAHLAVAILNWVVGAVGSTVRFGSGPARVPSATQAEMQELVARMRSGEIRTLVVAGPNPAYSMPSASGFADALASVENVISLNPHPDETTTEAGLVLPSHHELESWGDVELASGRRALRQPVMQPVFDTRQREDVLLQAAGAAGLGVNLGAEDFPSYLRSRWRELHAGAQVPFEDWWEERLRRGGLGVGGGAGDDDAGQVDVSLRDEALAHRFAEPGSGTEMTLVAFPTGRMYDGRGANRPWLQELPDPVTQLVWGSWAELHPETAEPLGLETGDVVELSTDAGSLRVPVYLYRGIRPDTVAVPLGQGHTAYGRTARDRGVNPLAVLPATTDPVSGALAYGGVDVEVTATGERSELVSLQGSDTDEEREIAELMGLASAREAVEGHTVDLARLVEAAYDADPQSPYRWGMSIDLNACTGCGACVTACYAENNIPVVGEEQAARGREMSWIRVERYFEDTADGGFHVVHEPMTCQHCGDAPCEPVCPVYAAYHNPEGLNVQVYNRCVGTRYCANNCPYKVRRFNWFTAERPYPANLQLNPDVTVRQKGVMEKCTFCVQRINRAKIQAKEERRPVRDGEVETACQAACPTDAIVFGNLKDPSSKVSQIAKGARSYHVLEELNTRPAVTYLKDVTAAELPEGNGHAGSGHGSGGGREPEH